VKAPKPDEPDLCSHFLDEMERLNDLGHKPTAITDALFEAVEWFAIRIILAKHAEKDAAETTELYLDRARAALRKQRKGG
jgi:hypothetical protein